MTALIIDVSNANPATEKQVRDSGAVALICKATEGTTFKDKTLPAHRKIARNVGIPFGAYVFLHPLSKGSEAETFLEYADLRVGDLQPIIDAEVTDGLPVATVAARVDSCARALEAAGYAPILYSSVAFWKQLFAARPSLKRLRVWEAQYPGRFTRWFPSLAARRIRLLNGVTVVMWQFTDSYTVDGRGFDMSVLMAPLDSLRIGL